MPKIAERTKSKRQVEYYVRWGFRNIGDLLAVLNHFIEDEVCVASFGQGDDQWEGYDLHEGKLIITHPDTKAGTPAILEWVSKPQDPTLNYWMSPCELEVDVETVNLAGKSEHGEAYDWGSRYE